MNFFMYYIPGLPWISYLTNLLTAKNDDLKFFCEYYANFIYMKNIQQSLN